MKPTVRRAEKTADGAIHVEPEGLIFYEVRDHELSDKCWCSPIVEQVPGRSKIVQHLPPAQSREKE